MNSRIENGQMTLNSKEAVVSKVKQWLANGDIEEIYEETDKYKAGCKEAVVCKYEAESSNHPQGESARGSRALR
jgi:hypothetical protein